MKDSAYKLIEGFYQDKRASRSGVFLIKHIDDGLNILSDIGASADAKAAYCIHPMLQGDEEFKTALENKFREFKGLSLNVIVLALEYRKVANSYLCRPHTDNYTVEDLKIICPLVSEDVRHMLIADKRQNQSDFLKHHNNHQRFKELDNYFKTWILYLEGDV